VTGRTQQEVWDSLADYDLRPALARLAIPAAVLHGSSDPIPIDTARTLAELLKAEFHPVPECGHVPYVEAFDEFVRVMDDFLPTGS
jgi:pimeloyl-ACP methyl ester carboxylesterase